MFGNKLTNRMERVDKRAAPRVLIVGVHQASDAYPNTLYRLQYLKDNFDTHEINEPLWATPQGGVTTIRSPLRTLWRALTIHVRLAWRVATGQHRDLAYIPYPAVGVALLLALLPRSRRPRIVVDGFISIYDTVVNDRGLWKPGALRARMLWALERRAFRIADVVVVDTLQNANFYARTFHLPRDRFYPVPLATNEDVYAPSAYQPTAGQCRVLFIGTLVPLHGIESIAHAARLLAHRPDVRFRILGDGDDARKLEGALKGLTNVDWQRRWHSAKELAGEIAGADICLGIFGAGDKTQRVCPYKLYTYASVGRATITGDTRWLRSIATDSSSGPFYAVPVNDGRALANAIEYLADNQSERERLARDANMYYKNCLANALSFAMLDNLLVNMHVRHG